AVSVCVTVTVTPGRIAPLESLTVPLSCAVACAHAAACAMKNMSTAPMPFRVNRVMPPPSFTCVARCYGHVVQVVNAAARRAGVLCATIAALHEGGVLTVKKSHHLGLVVAALVSVRLAAW